MKKARMNISHSRFILFKLKIFGEIVTTKLFYSMVLNFYYICTSLLPCQETAKGPFGLRVKLPPAHLSTTHGGSFTPSFLLLIVKQGSCKYHCF